MEEMEAKMEQLRKERNSLKNQIGSMKNNRLKNLITEKEATNSKQTKHIEQMKSEMNQRRNEKSQKNTSQDATISDLVKRLSELNQKIMNSDGTLQSMGNEIKRINELETQINKLVKEDEHEDLETKEMMEVYKESIIELIKEHKEIMKKLAEIESRKKVHPNQMSKRNNLYSEAVLSKKSKKTHQSNMNQHKGMRFQVVCVESQWYA